jgi:excinuclease ABC subunit C
MTRPQDSDTPDIEDFEPLAETDEEPSLPPLELDGGDTAPASVERGAAAIRAHWKHAPAGPGVYRMIAENGEVLYVGKAKSVRKRIASYMRAQGHTNRIARMIAQTVSMVFVSTETERRCCLRQTISSS